MHFIELLLSQVTLVDPVVLCSAILPQEVGPCGPLIVEMILHDFFPATLSTWGTWTGTAFQDEIFHEVDKRIRDTTFLPPEVVEVPATKHNRYTFRQSRTCACACETDCELT